MSSLITFENMEFGKLTVMEKDGEFFFIGKEVAEKLGYSNTRDALVRHIAEEDKGVVKHDTLGGRQSFTIINESGLYSCLLYTSSYIRRETTNLRIKTTGRKRD